MNLEKKRGFLNFLVIGASNSVADFIDREASTVDVLTLCFSEQSPAAGNLAFVFREQ